MRRLILAILLLVVFSALVVPSSLSAAAIGEPQGERIGPFTSYDLCKDSAASATVPHSGCFTCPGGWCYKVYPATEP